jgi:hypothetical protein
MNSSGFTALPYRREARVSSPNPVYEKPSLNDNDYYFPNYIDGLWIFAASSCKIM